MQKVIFEAMSTSTGEIFPDTCLCQNCFDKKKIIQPPVNTVLTWVNVSHINTLHCIWCGAKSNM